MSGHERCPGQRPWRGGSPADPLGHSQSDVSPEREPQVLEKIKKKMTGKCLRGPAMLRMLDCNSIME